MSRYQGTGERSEAMATDTDAVVLRVLCETAQGMLQLHERFEELDALVGQLAQLVADLGNTPKHLSAQVTEAYRQHRVKTHAAQQRAQDDLQRTVARLLSTFDDRLRRAEEHQTKSTSKLQKEMARLTELFVYLLLAVPPITFMLTLLAIYWAPALRGG